MASRCSPGSTFASTVGHLYATHLALQLDIDGFSDVAKDNVLIACVLVIGVGGDDVVGKAAAHEVVVPRNQINGLIS